MMARLLTGCAAAAVLVLASQGPAQAAIFNFRFDGTPDGTVTAPIVGTGTFSFDGAASVGTVALTSLTNYSFNFDVRGSSFGNADLATPAANIQVRFTAVTGGLSVTFGGSGGGPFGGSVDFTNPSSLSFQPNFGSLYFTTGFGTFEGLERTDTTVPEPMSLALFGLGLAGLVAARRRA